MSTAKTFFLEIVSPERKVFSGEVEFGIFPGAEGQFGVLPHHAPLLSLLIPGEIKIIQNKQAAYFAVSGGFVEVRENKVTVAAETCETASEIDTAQASGDKKSALEELSHSKDKALILQAQKKTEDRASPAPGRRKSLPCGFQGPLRKPNSVYVPASYDLFYPKITVDPP
jgi:F-type H+-transporting ATPase subunit epsilon